jgi:hypothetical protein
MDAILRYAFMDESGTVGAGTGTHFLVVAALTVSNPRELELPIRRVMKKFGTSLGSGEIKAADYEEAVILRLLKGIAAEDVVIIATLVDQRAIRVAPQDAEAIYRYAVTRTVRTLAKRFPRLELSIDKRYTNSHLRDLLERAIRDELENLPRQNVIIRQENSVSRKELQAADAVVWAIFQKYERGDSRFYDIIESKIAEEVVVRQQDWIKRKSPARGDF